MDRSVWKDFLEQSSADVRLTRGERDVLRQIIDGCSTERKGEMRRQLFDFVCQALPRPQDKQLVEYLEDVLKILDSSRLPTSAAAQVHFFPGERGRQALAAFLAAARQSLDICVFTITDDQIADAIIAAHRAGAKVRVITDDDKSQDLGSDIGRIAKAGVLLRTDTTPAHMHHKFAIRDGVSLLNGSYNWTRSAFVQNRENIVIESDPALIKAFSEEFERLWAEFD